MVFACWVQGARTSDRRGCAPSPLCRYGPEFVVMKGIVIPSLSHLEPSEGLGKEEEISVNCSDKGDLMSRIQG
jgi:hypothetical protein